MTLIIIITAGIIMIISAIYAVYSGQLISAIIASGIISLIASILYLILASPDVAMTEAAIGSVLTSIVFLFAVRRIRDILEKENADDSHISESNDMLDREEIDD